MVDRSRPPLSVLSAIEIVQGLSRDNSRSSVDSPHWLFRPLSRFQGASGDQRPPGTRQSRRTDPDGGGGALNPTQRFDPIGPASGRVLTLRRQCRSVKSDSVTREQRNTIHLVEVPQPTAPPFPRLVGDERQPPSRTVGCSRTSDGRPVCRFVIRSVNGIFDKEEVALTLALL